MLPFRRQSPSEAMTVCLQPGAGQDAAEDVGDAPSGSETVSFVPRNDACLVGCAGVGASGFDSRKNTPGVAPAIPHSDPLITEDRPRPAMSESVRWASEVGLADCTSLAGHGQLSFLRRRVEDA